MKNFNFKNKIVLFSFLTFLLSSGIFGFVDSARADLTVGTSCTDGSVYVTPTLQTSPTYDIYQTYIEASTTCANKGSGWRLPTLSELNTLYLNKNAIWGNDMTIGCIQHNPLCGISCNATCGPNFFWSSSSSGSNVWIQSILSGQKINASIDSSSRAESRCVKTPEIRVDCIRYVLTINTAGNGSGTVTGAGTYNSGAIATANATPSEGSTFTGWSRDCNAGGQVTMTSAKTCTANFRLFSGGEGSVANPYKLSSCTELQAVKNYLTSNFILINDIDCSDTVNWNSGAGFVPIGTYKGNFNGAGFKIINLNINRPSTDYVGLFSWIYGATIRNVDLVNVNISGHGITGGLVGFSNGTITNCSSSGSVTTTSWHAGGLVGGAGAYSIFTNSSSAGSVKGDWYVGGLIGDGGVSISSSFSSASVIGNKNVGGLIGASNTGDNGSILNSYAIGNVTGGTNVGGLVGASSGTTITNSYSSGSVNGSSPIGGLVGGLYSTTFTNSYYDKLTSGQTDTGRGIPKITLDMKNKTTFTNWDFTNIWGLTSTFNSGYPCLRWHSNCVGFIPTVTLTASSSSIIAGASSTLTWNVADATSCTATGAEVLWANSNLATSTGAHTWDTGILNTVGNHNYGITCTGAGGTAIATTTVTTVSAPSVSVTLTASPSSLMVGQTSTLTWNVANATSCTATGAEVLWANSNLATSTGTHTWPTGILNTIGDHTYGIICTGNNGPVTATAIVTVNTGTIENPEVESGGDNISKCQAVDVSWSAYPGADHYDVMCSGSPSCTPVTTSGITATVRNLTPRTNYSFAIVAYNSSGVEIASATTHTVKSGDLCTGPTGSCSLSKDMTNPIVNHTTTWTVGLTPACPDCTYSWSGTDINSSPAPTVNPFSQIYTIIGPKNISVLVKNSIGGTFCTASSATAVSFSGGTTKEK